MPIYTHNDGEHSPLHPSGDHTDKHNDGEYPPLHTSGDHTDTHNDGDCLPHKGNTHQYYKTFLLKLEYWDQFTPFYISNFQCF